MQDGVLTNGLLAGMSKQKKKVESHVTKLAQAWSATATAAV